MNWDDLVREYFPFADDEERRYILWERTAFPLVGVDEVKRQLQEYLDTAKQGRRSISE